MSKPDTVKTMNRTPSTEELEFVGAILEANITQSQALSNSVIETTERTAYEYAKDFIRFYRAVDRAAEFLTTRAMENVLSAYEWRVSFAQEFVTKYEAEHPEKVNR